MRVLALRAASTIARVRDTFHMQNVVLQPSLQLMTVHADFPQPIICLWKSLSQR